MEYPKLTMYRDKRVEDLTHEEALECIQYLGKEIQSLRESNEGTLRMFKLAIQSR